LAKRHTRECLCVLQQIHDLQITPLLKPEQKLFHRLSGNGRYYSDFRLSLHHPDKKHIAFIDPKDLQSAGNLMENDKVRFVHQIKEYEQALNEEKGSQDVHLHAFVVSQTSFQTLRAKSGLDTKDEFHEHHILFPEGRDPASSYVNGKLSETVYPKVGLADDR
jgi:hypothetical protein